MGSRGEAFTFASRGTAAAGAPLRIGSGREPAAASLGGPIVRTGVDVETPVQWSLALILFGAALYRSARSVALPGAELARRWSSQRP